MAPVMVVEGDVVAVHGYWTEDRSRIVTEATVQTPDGPVVVSQRTVGVLRFSRTRAGGGP